MHRMRSRWPQRPLTTPPASPSSNFSLKPTLASTATWCEELGLAQATISQHLQELRDIGIIQGTIEGSRRSCASTRNSWDEIKRMFTELFNSMNLGSRQLLLKIFILLVVNWQSPDNFHSDGLLQPSPDSPTDKSKRMAIQP
ncbi:MAG: ArsR family transcriptional regulator [Saprospiraceae bacterium]